MALVRAVYKDQVIAESENTLVVEGNHYFPKEDVQFSLLIESDTSTHCPWKGDASYHSVKVGNDILNDACWFYLAPSQEARRLKGHYAFWGDVKIIKESSEEQLKNICTETVKFMKGIVKNTKGAEVKCPLVAEEFKSFLGNVGNEVLTLNLPPDYINSLGFFNFYNSTNACFLTNHENKITKTNPTFNWAFDGIDTEDLSFRELLKNLKVEGEYINTVFETVKSHGWVKIPRIRVEKDGIYTFYSLDIAIAKHGDLESLTGLQGQFIDVTKEVELSSSVEDLLNNAGEGFLSFCSNFIIQEKYSHICEKFFDGAIAGINILSLLFPDKETRREIEESLEVIFTELAQLDMMIDVLPKEVIINNNCLGIDYRWIPKSDSSSSNRMMLILKDITKEKALEETLKNDQARQESIIKIVTDREGYLDLQEELVPMWKNIFSILENKELNLNLVNELFRAFHSIKGGCAVYSLNSVVELAHSLEEKLSKARDDQSNLLENKEIWINESRELKEAYNESIEEFNKLLGIEQSEHKDLSINEKRIDDVFQTLKNNVPEEFFVHVDEASTSLRKQSIKGIFQKYKNSGLDLAKKLDKKIDVVIQGENTDIDKERFDGLFGNLIHLVRNSVDHGLEDSFERVESNKPSVGKLKISCEKNESTLRLIIADDGRGIDPSKMKAVAREKNILTDNEVNRLSDQEAIELVFHPGFSSKEEVSDISGRGVGMDAVKTAVKNLSGTIEIKSKVGEGTCFIIELPKSA